jgi:hypothetical protein
MIRLMDLQRADQTARSLRSGNTHRASDFVPWLSSPDGGGLTFWPGAILNVSQA